MDRLWKQRAERLAKKRRMASSASSLAAAPAQGAASSSGPSRAAAPSQSHGVTAAPSRAAAPSQGQAAPWQAWAAHILKKAQTHRDGLGRQKRPIRVVELCSGLCTGTQALKAVGLFDAVTIMSVDPSPAAIRMTAASGDKSQHHFNRIADILAAAQAECQWHGGPCEVQLADTDILVIGLSCKPYSRQRLGRLHAGSAEAHPEFFLMEEFLDVMRTHQIPLAVFENVIGFLREEAGEELPVDHLDRLVNNLRDAGYECLGMKLDARTWLPVSRPRFFLMIGRRDLCSGADLRQAAHIIQDIESEVHVPSIKECLFNPGDAEWHAMQRQWLISRSRQRAAAPTQGQVQIEVQSDDPSWKRSSSAHRSTLLRKNMIGWGLKPWTDVRGRIQQPRMRGFGPTEAKQELLDLAFLFGCDRKGVDPREAMRRQQTRENVAANLYCDVSQGICRKPWMLDVLHCSTTASQWYSFERDGLLDPRELFRLHGFDTPPEAACAPAELQVLIGNCMAVPSVGAVLHGLLCACGWALPNCFERTHSDAAAASSQGAPPLLAD